MKRKEFLTKAALSIAGVCLIPKIDLTASAASESIVTHDKEVFKGVFEDLMCRFYITETRIRFRQITPLFKSEDGDKDSVMRLLDTLKDRQYYIDNYKLRKYETYTEDLMYNPAKYTIQHAVVKDEGYELNFRDMNHRNEFLASLPPCPLITHIQLLMSSKGIHNQYNFYFNSTKTIFDDKTQTFHRSIPVGDSKVDYVLDCFPKENARYFTNL